MTPQSRHNPVLDEFLRTGKTLGPDGKPVAVRSVSIRAEDGLLLQRLIHLIGATRTLEIGLAYGMSALFICEALQKTPHAKHVVIDPYQNSPDSPWRGCGVRNLEAAGYRDLVDFHERPSHLVLPELLQKGESIDLAFIDGSHLFDYALVDFFYVDRLLRPGGILVFDDVQIPAVRKLISFIGKNRAYEVFRDDLHEGGFLRAVTLRKTADDSRAPQFHEDF